MSTSSQLVPPEASPTARFRAWPLWAAAAGLLGLVATVLTDSRAGDSASDVSYTVTVDDLATLGHLPFRVGGVLGYGCVAALICFAAIWHRRVGQRFAWSLGAPVVTFGLVAGAAALTLAYGWKGALGDYLPGAVEHGAYDDEGLYTYYVLNDFSPYIGWLPVAVALGGLAWMAFGERLVTRGIGAVAALFCVGPVLAAAVTGVPGLPFLSMLGLVVSGAWLSVSRSTITQEVTP